MESQINSLETRIEKMQERFNKEAGGFFTTEPPEKSLQSSRKPVNGLWPLIYFDWIYNVLERSLYPGKRVEYKEVSRDC